MGETYTKNSYLGNNDKTEQNINAKGDNGDGQLSWAKQAELAEQMEIKISDESAFEESLVDFVLILLLSDRQTKWGLEQAEEAERLGQL